MGHSNPLTNSVPFAKALLHEYFAKVPSEMPQYLFNCSEMSFDLGPCIDDAGKAEGTPRRHRLEMEEDVGSLVDHASHQDIRRKRFRSTSERISGQRQSKVSRKVPQSPLDSMMGHIASMYYTKDRAAPEISLDGRGSARRSVTYVTLDALLSPLRKPYTWAPREIAVYEAAMYVFGKNFYEIQKLIPNKSTNDVVEFYYSWKRTKNYKVWKEKAIRPFEGISDTRNERVRYVMNQMSFY